MTKKEIEVLSGRELDAMVAEYMFGESVVKGYDDFFVKRDRGVRHHLTFYSSCANYAWEVVDYMGMVGWRVLIESSINPDPEKFPLVWRVRFMAADGYSAWGFGETVSVAICRAALLAVFKKRKSDIVINVDRYFCRPTEFNINGEEASLEDFGNGGDSEPLSDVSEEDDINGYYESRYCCGNYVWRRNRPADDVLKKYDITLKEYNDICNVLEDKLSFGHCCMCL